MASEAVRLEVEVVVVSVADERPRVLTVAGEARLPSGDFVPARDRTLELAARRLIAEQAGGLGVGYLEQLYTFGDRFRDPREVSGGPRRVSVGYLALVGADAAATAGEGVVWRDWYAFFPWEDARVEPVPARAAIAGRVAAIGGDEKVRRWARIVFGLDGSNWNTERVLERYELLYELRAVAEAGPGEPGFGEPMALDHRRILATAIGRVRGKIAYRPIVFELLPAVFTLSELQRTVESLAGLRLHGPNFRRLVSETRIVEDTGERRKTLGRPARTYRFRPEVLAERPDPGIGVR